MWVLVVAFVSAAISGYGALERHGVAMQEFTSLASCQFASVEVQKLTPTAKVVCVPK